MEEISFKEEGIRSEDIEIENEDMKEFKISNEKFLDIEFVAVEIQDVNTEEEDIKVKNEEIKEIKIEEIFNSEIHIKEEPFGFKEDYLFPEEEACKSEVHQLQEGTNSDEFYDLNSVAEEKYQEHNTVESDFPSTRGHLGALVEPTKRVGSESIEDVCSYKSTECDDTFIDTIILSKHVQSCNGPIAFECRQLDKCYWGKICLPMKDTPRLFKCKDCVFSCIKKGDLTRHKRTLHVNESFQCPQCTLTFDHKNSLNYHILSFHIKEKRFRCGECSYSSVSKSHLTRHIGGIHKKETPFKCRECDMAFGRRNNLKTHVLISHRKEKHFKCSECSYICINEIHLTQHISAVHRKEKPFKCCDCEMTFGYENCLKRHKKSKHFLM